MKPPTCFKKMAFGVRVLALTVVLMAFAGLSATVSAQSPPPVRGTMALEGTMKTFYRAANTVIVATVDGVEHAYRFTKDLLVHGGKGAGADALAGLDEGSAVVVHYLTAEAGETAVEIDRVGGEGLKVTEGVIKRIDRGRKQITIRFDNGTTETLQLTEHAAAEAGKDVDEAAADATKIIVYYSDEGGRKLAHFFRRVS
jgi:hypothetical protein